MRAEELMKIAGQRSILSIRNLRVVAIALGLAIAQGAPTRGQPAPAQSVAAHPAPVQTVAAQPVYGADRPNCRPQVLRRFVDAGRVPDLHDCTLAEAGRALGGHDITLEPTYVRSAAPRDSIRDQRPGPNSSLDGVGQIFVSVSDGRDAPATPPPPPPPQSRSADISVTIDAGKPGTRHVGETIGFRVRVSNNGPAPAYGVRLTDRAANLQVTNVAGRCGAIPCGIPSLPAGGEERLAIDATVLAEGPFEYDISAIAKQDDPDRNNNTARSFGRAVPRQTPVEAHTADISVAIDAGKPGTRHAGDTVRYAVTLSNNGPAPAVGVRLTDRAANLQVASVAGACSAMPCGIASLPAGGSERLVIDATVLAEGPFEYDVAAIAKSEDPDRSNNTARSFGRAVPRDQPVDRSVDVRLTATPSPNGPYRVGQSVRYGLVVSNAGPSTAASVGLRQSSSGLKIDRVSGACSALPCVIPALNSGYPANLQVQATIVADGDFDYAATVTANGDTDLANNTAEIRRTTERSADVQVAERLDTEAPYRVGQQIRYAIAVSNNGPSTATNIAIRDAPTRLRIVAASGACSALPCTLASLDPNERLTIEATASIEDEGDFSNEVSATAAEPDADPGNNTDQRGGTATKPNDHVTGPADLSVTETLHTAGPHRVGQQVHYSIVVSNAGPATATNVLIKDISNRLRITEVAGACGALPCRLNALAAGAEARIDMRAEIEGGGRFDDKAAATAAEPDTDATNNTTDPRGGFAWPIWLVLAIAATSLGAAGGAAAAIERARRLSWARRIAVTPSLDLDGDSSAGPMPLAAPPLEIEARVEEGAASPDGPVMITREEVVDA